MCATLKRSAIFHHEPKEPSFHVLITFSHYIDFWFNYEGISVVFSQCLRNCAKARCKRVSARHDGDLQKENIEHKDGERAVRR